MMEYELIRSKRKTLGLYIKGGRLEVRAPLSLSKKEIDNFVTSKTDWISSKLANSQAVSQTREDFSLNYGDMVLYLDNEYPIGEQEGNRVGFDDERFYMPPRLTQDQIKSACAQIYRMLAKQHLTNRVMEFSKQMGVLPVVVKINGAKSRWGSCSAKKSLNFSWRLIMADSEVVDYVVVHELAHITEMNHSSRFWAIVEGVLPDYMERKERLRQLSKRLAGENWG